MNNAEKIQALCDKAGNIFKITEPMKIFGLTYWKKSQGWLSVKDEGDFWKIMLCSHKKTHYYSYGPMIAANIRKNDGLLHTTGSGNDYLSGIYTSTKPGGIRAAENDAAARPFFQKMEELINMAYLFYCSDKTK